MTTQSRPIKAKAHGQKGAPEHGQTDDQGGSRHSERRRNGAKKLSNLQRLRKTIKIYDHFVFKINLERKRGKDQPHDRCCTKERQIEREKERRRAVERERELQLELQIEFLSWLRSPPFTA